MADYYTDSNVPSTGGALTSATIRAEFDLISAGFVKVAPYTGNGGKIVAINAGGTAQEAIASASVAQGGTGRATSTTAYGLIAAGTTATGAHQTLAAGATTEVLVGGGASALPVWTAATGSGAPVRATSPTLVTPTLGVATVTSINGNAITTGTGTLTLGAGSTLVTSATNSITLTSTGATNVTLPTSGTLATTSGSHSVMVTTGNGQGSTNTKIRRYTTTQVNLGTDITYADSAANGGSFTINTTGVYSISRGDALSTASGMFGISVNSNELTTAVQTISATHRRGLTETAAANLSNSVSVTLSLTAGDVVRAHDAGTVMDNVAAAYSWFIITKVGTS